MTSILVDARVSLASGIGRYVMNTLPHVAAGMSNIGFELLVSPNNVTRANVACRDAANVHVTSTELVPFTLAEQVRLAGYARGHALTWFTNYWVPLSFRSPFIAMVHDVLHLEPVLFPSGRVTRALSRRTFTHVARRAAAVMYASRFTRREFEHRFGAPSYGVVTSNGIDHRGWQPFDPNHPPMKSKRVLLVAAPKQHKNFAMALHAFAQAGLSDKWRLTLVLPDQTLRSSIDVATLARDHDRVDIRVGVSNDELRTLYGDSAVLLMPTFYEGFGMPLLEGLQAGAQCISSTADALVEIGQGTSTTWVNPADAEGWVSAIEHVCRSWDEGKVDGPALAENMRHAATYRWQTVAERTIDVIDYALRQA